MASIPRLKTVLHTLPFLVAGAVLGFASAVLAVRLTASDGSGSGPGTASVPAGGSAPSPGPVSGKRAVSLPSAGDFQRMEASGRLACALRLRGLSAEQRQALLEDCLHRSGPERTALLSLLLSEWAESEPSPAAEWVLSHLKGAESQKCLDDVLRTWAARDGEHLAQWADAQFPKQGHSLTSRAMLALERYAPLWFARMSEMECNRASVWSQMEFAGLRAPGAAKAISSELQGHVAYTSDPAEMSRAMATGSSGRHAMGKWGWNELFETTAVQWYAEDPAACDQWLATWPENAQAAARYFIDEAETKAKTKANPALETNPDPEQTAPPGSSSTGSPDLLSPQIQASSLPDASAPASGAVDQQIQAWSQWWRGHAAEAEAFLSTAAWPDDLKFRARAKAYSGAP